jgi:hypothetical protein
MAGRTKEGSLWRRDIVQSAATQFVFRFAASSGSPFQVVMNAATSLQPNLPYRGDPLQTFPWKIPARDAGATKTGGEEFCYFAQVNVDGSNPSGGNAVAQRQSVIASQEAVQARLFPGTSFIRPPGRSRW